MSQTRGALLRLTLGLVVGAVALAVVGPRTADAAVTREEVERAIREGVRYLIKEQKENGSWPDYNDGRFRTGVTSLVTLALLTAGEKPDSPAILKAVAYLRGFSPGQLDSTYTIALQTMVFAGVTPEKDGNRIAANVDWLERAQIRPDAAPSSRGAWPYGIGRHEGVDNSNSQYALLGLHAASEVGAAVNPEVWNLARSYWQGAQQADGGWGYHYRDQHSTASMTAAGVSSLVITGLRRYQGAEHIEGGTIHNCGKGGDNINLGRGINWLANNFSVGQNFGLGQQWRHYYLYGLERAGRLAGLRFFGEHDWYREGAEKLVHEQDRLSGFWRGGGGESPLLATSFALLFLSKGRAPVLINKLVHGPRGDWNHDVDDVRNIVNLVSQDWKNLLTWQFVNPAEATVEDMLQAPIVFFNGHAEPVFTAVGERRLREYVEQGGFIIADACCNSQIFHEGFQKLMKRVFPEEEYKLKPLSDDHPVWRAKHLLNPTAYPLWGIEHGCRTVVIYSPKDLSCFWNQLERSERDKQNTAILKAAKVGQNIIDYATGRELPPDKLASREVHDFKRDAPRLGTLRIAKLEHPGDWNIAPLAIPNLMSVLSKPPLSFDVTISQKALRPTDPNLIYYPLVYVHGRAAASFSKEDLDALRKHVDPGGGTIFADAACGSPAFDASFRRLVAELFPNNPQVPIPKDDELLSTRVYFDLKDVQYTKAAGGAKDYPQLEGVKINGHWSIVYSKYDIGCALERHSALDCKGYNYDSALRIAANIVIYSTLP
ncbi:MAG: DUF4159 domain-containing protein [Paludisphaera borealis]|uniref:DUF4159 domain-containing protein n=1 Tax=Paludisphaera borealis TaxID=1387353 RepID=UPI00285116A5|nr:DUF4159 domain-containing protein [Paludisphaera borealis]MDR3623014.1 DUF4159 domain-containing protein [Paludisphaera borealis]